MEDQARFNTVIVVLGASGDLAKKKTFPALFSLFRKGCLPVDVKIVGYARTKMDHDEFVHRATLYIKSDTEADVESFKGTLSYVSDGYADEESFQGLNKHIEELEAKYDTMERHRIFYLALPPSVLISASNGLKKYCHSGEAGINRIIFELQPFGRDLDSAKTVLGAIHQQWTENETFRIDHYLDKEIMRNLLMLRFTNQVFSPNWDKNSISNVQIICKESFGTEGRGGQFDEHGIIRLKLQNHLLQILTILAMERPMTFISAKDIRDARLRVLRCIPPVEKYDTLLGQYTAANGKLGYLDEDSVPSDSICPTYAATTLWVKNSRWEGVPFILQAGKALDESKVEVRIQFKEANQGFITRNIPRNELVIQLKPNESISWKLNSQTPGPFSRLVPAVMDLTNQRQFSNPKAYESLILGVVRGDHSDFVRDDEVEAAWKIFTPIIHWLDGTDTPRPQLLKYAYGSEGPAELEGFIEKYGYRHREHEFSLPMRPVMTGSSWILDDGGR